MSKDIRLETANEFLKWANRQPKERRFKLASRNSYDHGAEKHTTTYLLEVCGTGSSWRGNNCIYISNDIGEPLSLEWKKSEWGRFVGMWSIKKILSYLYGQGGAGDWKAMQEVLDAKRAQETRRIAAENAQAVATRIAVDLVKLDDYLEKADLKGSITGGVIMPGLNDIRYVLEGFLEVTE